LLQMVDKRVFIGGKERIFRVVPHPGAVCILPWRDGQVALIRQLRPAVDKVIWEVPAGTLEDGEDPAQCAARELAEETGLRAGRLVKLASFFVAPGYSSEYMYIYAALDLEAGERSLDDSEEIDEVQWFSLPQALQMIDEGVIEDAKTLIALYLAEKKLA